MIIVRIMNLRKLVSQAKLRGMIDDFARPEWAEAHEKFAADVVAGLAWLGGGLWRTRPAEARPDAAKTSAPLTIAPSACSRGYPQYVRQ